MGQRTIKNKFTISSAFPVHKYSEKAGFYADLIIKYLVSADYFLKKKILLVSIHLNDLTRFHLTRT